MNSRIPSVVSAVVATAFLLSDAGGQEGPRKKKPHVDPDLTKLPAVSKLEGLTYEKDIKPILEESCFRCHGNEKQKGGLRLDSLEVVLKGGKEGKVVVPGDSTKSPLVISAAQIDPDTAMPPKKGPGGRGPGGAPPAAAPAPETPAAGPGATQAPARGGPGGQMAKPLTADQVGILRAWIDQGAK